MVDDEVELLEEEWLEYEPVVTRKNSAVECDTCGGITPAKYHMSRTGFSLTCNKCRRKESVRKSQAAYHIRKVRQDTMASRKLSAALTGRLDKLINLEKLRIEAARKRAATRNRDMTAREYRLFNNRLRIVTFYESIRSEMLADIVRGNPKPFMHYMNDEELRKKYYGEENDTGRKSEGADQEDPEEVWG